MVSKLFPFTTIVLRMFIISEALDPPRPIPPRPRPFVVTEYCQLNSPTKLLPSLVLNPATIGNESAITGSVVAAIAGCGIVERIID